MRYLLALLLLSGCSGSQAIYVLPGEFSPEQELAISDGAELWNQHLPTHEQLNLVFGTPSGHARMVQNGRGDGKSPGMTMTNRDLVFINIEWLERDKGMFLLPSVAAHEFAHLEGCKHTQDETALMYSVNSVRNMQVTESDLTEWRRVH